ncbi:MAG: glycosyltransferase family 2 protein [Clostridia bacterium]
MTDHKQCLEHLAIILPSLDPDNKFDKVVEGLVQAGFAQIVIVDDGSDAAHQIHFDKAAKYPCVRVLHHGVNKGKGRALKTAFRFVLDELPEAAGVITIDGDGQHLLEDIIACGEKMLSLDRTVVLGCRDFDAPGVPPRSVSGNKTTNRMFKLFFGITISDTQTGLRAIPRGLLEAFCAMEGERFEYETNMLLMMQRQGIPFVEQPIATVYDPDDYSSHYHAVKDSWRIFKIMAKARFGKK